MFSAAVGREPGHHQSTTQSTQPLSVPPHPPPPPHQIKRTSCSTTEPFLCSFIVIYLACEMPCLTPNFKLSSSFSLLLSCPITDSCSQSATGQVTEPRTCNYGWSHSVIFMPCQRLFTDQECVLKWQALNCPL